MADDADIFQAESLAGHFDSDIRQWPSLAAFAAYLQTVPRPSWAAGITNHNTFRPDETNWHGLSSMRSIQSYYIRIGWTSGPHLFLAAEAPDPADTGVFQMTPLSHVGTHAGPCNRDHIGVESVGNFDARPPTAAQYTLLLAVNRLIMRHWTIPPEQVNVHRECMPGRTCPGTFLSGPQLRHDLAQPWPRPPRPPISNASAMLWPPRATAEQCTAWLVARPNGDYSDFEVAAIVGEYFANAAGLDPLLAIAQMAHETGSLSSAWAAIPRRNPAGIGVTGPGRGLTFESWHLATRSHIGRLLAYALPRESGTPDQQALIRSALSDRRLPPAYRGIAPNLGGLNGRWAPSATYTDRIIVIANQIASDA